MKTFSKHYREAGNMALVQFETLVGEGLDFIPGAAAIERGDMVIKEVEESGVVNTLLAINLSDKHCLLTDMDLLKGARQNRVINTSVLIAPNSKQELGVSCVERSRWSYSKPDFSPAPENMDLNMRAAKARSLKKDSKEGRAETQSKIWGMIREEMEATSFMSTSEDYNYLLESKRKERRSMPRIGVELGCNGLAVFEGQKLIAFDVFGNRKAYRHYFDHLLRDAFSRMSFDPMQFSVGKDKALYLLDEYQDDFTALLESEPAENAGGAADLYWEGPGSFSGFELRYEDQPVHRAGFAGD